MNIQDITKPTNLNKTFREQRAQQLFDNLAEGYEDPMEAYVLIKHLQDMLALMEKKVAPMAMAGAAKFAKGDGAVMGVRFEVSSRTTYAYDHDEEHANLTAAVKAREAAMKEALKQQQKGQFLRDMNTGEVVPPARPKTSEFIKFDWPK